MQLEAFLNVIVFLFITDQSFQPTLGAAEIDFNKLPSLDCVKIARKYLALTATMSHRDAVSELSLDIDYLEKCGLDFTIIGKDDEEISSRFNKFLKEHRFIDLGKRLSAAPHLGQEILNSFDLDRPAGLQPYVMQETFPKVYFDFLFSVKQGKELVRIPNFEKVSDMIGGFGPGRIIMIMGETGFGKTNFAMNLVVCASTSMRCLYFNMEMPIEDIIKRLAVLVSGKSFGELFRGEITLDEATKGLSVFGKNLKITNGRTVSAGSIEALMIKEKQSGLDLVVIDYDQKIDLSYSKNIPEWKLIQLAIQKIEDVAKDLNVCVLILVQANREGSISSSHRATFTAHTVLNFKKNDHVGGPQSANAIVVAEKNRHGRKDQACLLTYNQDNLRINEHYVIDYMRVDKLVKREKTI
jgi:KaiC/GvpD/RAD55 family RecA-like ATPase